MHCRWRSVGPGGTRRPLHAQRHATRARNIRAAPASVLDRSAAPSAADAPPQQGQGRLAGSPAGRRGGWRTANGVLHYTGDDASEPGSQAQLSGSSVAANSQAEGAAAAARGTSLAAPARSDSGWALVRWEDPSALAGAGGAGTPRGLPDSPAGASDPARAQEPARTQGQSGGGSKKRRARRTWLQQPTRAATVTWVVGDGGAVPQEAGLQPAGADTGFRTEGSAQPAAAGEAAPAELHRAGIAGSSSAEGRVGVGTWGAAGSQVLQGLVPQATLRARWRLLRLALRSLAPRPGRPRMRRAPSRLRGLRPQTACRRRSRWPHLSQLPPHKRGAAAPHQVQGLEYPRLWTICSPCSTARWRRGARRRRRARPRRCCAARGRARCAMRRSAARATPTSGHAKSAQCLKRCAATGVVHIL